MVVRQRSFFPRNGDGVKECLQRRLAEAPAALMRSFLIIACRFAIVARISPMVAAKQVILCKTNPSETLLIAG